MYHHVRPGRRYNAPDVNHHIFYRAATVELRTVPVLYSTSVGPPISRHQALLPVRASSLSSHLIYVSQTFSSFLSTLTIRSALLSLLLAGAALSTIRALSQHAP